MTELYVTEALDRVPAEAAGPGEIVALAGLPEVTIGETIADAEDPRPLPVTAVDEPSLAMTLGINTSPLAGTEGDKLTASALIGRLEQELVGNVSLRVRPTSRPDVWEVQDAASSSWPCSSRSCAARASSSPSASRRS